MIDNIIEVKIPKGFMNCGVSKDNIFFADTNDSSNWDTIKFPLPKPTHEWHMCEKINNGLVVLIDRV